MFISIVASVFLLSVMSCKEKKPPVEEQMVFETVADPNLPRPTAHSQYAPKNIAPPSSISRSDTIEQPKLKQQPQGISQKNIRQIDRKAQQSESPAKLLKTSKKVASTLVSTEPKTIVEKIKEESLKEAALTKPKLRNTSNSRHSYVSASSGRQLFEKASRLARQAKFNEAKELYLSSCQAGYPEGCHRYGYYEHQVGNFANAIRFYRLSCQKGILKSCNNLGVGMEAQGDLAAAQDFFSLACIDHHKKSCTNLKRVISRLRHAH